MSDADSDRSERSDRAEMLDTLDVAIREAREKVESGRIYDNENERTRVKWLRALCYAVNIRRQVERDQELDDLSERLEKLEERLEETETEIGPLPGGVGR